MKATLQPDPIRASLTLYYVIALNHSKPLGRTINKKEAAIILSDQLGIDVRAPKAWLRGNFRTHPVSRENFLKFIRKYQGRPGLESAAAVKRTAQDLFGVEYQKAIELLGISEKNGGGEVAGGNVLTGSILNVIEESSAEQVKQALLQLGRAYTQNVLNEEG